jgi:hypothetical protein
MMARMDDHVKISVYAASAFAAAFRNSEVIGCKQNMTPNFV